MAQEDQDKTEQPTSFRLEEARKKGEVAKSTDAVGVAVMVAFAVTVAMTAGQVSGSLLLATRRMIALAGSGPVFNTELVHWVGRVYAPVWQALSPLLLAIVVVAVVANVFQTRPIFTSHPISPDFKRLNPANTVKRLFSLRTFWELGKLIVKMSLLAGLCVVAASHAQTMAVAVASSVPRDFPALMLAGFIKTSIYVLLVLALMALVDLIFTRRDFLRRMRMSRRELRDEFKRRDGDPDVKSKQKKLIRDLLKKARAVSKAAEADVILTNPTHVAVALQYRPQAMRAPRVLAMGAGFLSQRIRQVASRAGVPIVRSPVLARALYRECDIDGSVPEHLYADLVPIYRKLLGRDRQGASK